MTTKDILKKYRNYRDLKNYFDRKLALQWRMGIDASIGELAARDRYAELVSHIESAINGVTDPTEQLLLRLRYIDGWSWTKISFAIHYSLAQTKRIHEKAIAHLERNGFWSKWSWVEEDQA